RLGHPVQLLANANSVPRNGVGDLALEAHPVAGAVVALAVPVPGHGELCRQPARLELEDADQVLGLDQLASDLVVGVQTLREDHEKMIQTKVLFVNAPEAKFTSSGALFSRQTWCATPFLARLPRVGCS